MAFFSEEDSNSSEDEGDSDDGQDSDQDYDGTIDVELERRSTGTVYLSVVYQSHCCRSCGCDQTITRPN